MRSRYGVELNLVHHGRGPVRAVLVHGLASNALLWDGVAESLAEMGLPSVAVDLRGHGQSDRPDTGYDMATVADEVADVVLAVSDRPVVLVGQSWGGNVVVECAARNPRMAESVVGVDGGLIRLADDFADRGAAWEVLAPPRFDGMKLDMLEPMIRSRLAGWPATAMTGALANFEEDGDGFVKARLSRDRHRLILEGLFEHDPGAALARVSVPILMLLTSESAQRLDDRHRLARGVRIEVVDADHDVHAQYPNLVAGLIAEMT